MSEPCKQAGIIGGLKATNEAIQDTLERLLDGQDKFIHILESIAKQGTKIEKLETDTEGLYARVRKAELKAVEQGTRITMAAGFVSAIIGVVTAFIVKHLGK